MGLGRKLFTAGAVIAGAVAGALFAPKKGSQLRKEFKKEWDKGGSGVNTLKKHASAMGEDISQTAKGLYESETVQKGKTAATEAIKDVYETAKTQAQELTAQAKEQAEDLADKAKEQAGDFADKAKDKINEMRKND